MTARKQTRRKKQKGGAVIINASGHAGVRKYRGKGGSVELSTSRSAKMKKLSAKQVAMLRALRPKFIGACLKKGMSMKEANMAYEKMLKMKGAGFFDFLKSIGRKVVDIGKAALPDIKKAVAGAIPGVASALGTAANEYVPGAGKLIAKGGDLLSDYVGSGAYIGRGVYV